MVPHTGSRRASVSNVQGRGSSCPGDLASDSHAWGRGASSDPRKGGGPGTGGSRAPVLERLWSRARKGIGPCRVRARSAAGAPGAERGGGTCQAAPPVGSRWQLPAAAGLLWVSSWARPVPRGPGAVAGCGRLRGSLPGQACALPSQLRVAPVASDPRLKSPPGESARQGPDAAWRTAGWAGGRGRWFCDLTHAACGQTSWVPCVCRGRPCDQFSQSGILLAK